MDFHSKDSVGTLKSRRLTAGARRKQIMKAALKLFARNGYERTTTRAIAEEAAISEGTIYKYYDSKEDLLFAFLQTTVLKSLDTIMGSLKGAGDGEIVREFFSSRFALALRHQKLMKVILGEAFFNPRLADALAKKLIFPALGILENYIARRIDEGDFRRVNPTVAARSLMGNFLGFAIWNIVFGGKGKKIPEKDLAEGFASLFLKGVLK